MPEIDSTTLTAIPTIYNGIQLRSRMEAQCAFLFDKMKMDWSYEPKSFMLKNGISYRPDFIIDPDVVVECRGYSTPKGDAQIDGFKNEFVDLGFSAYVLLSSEGCVCYTKAEPAGSPAYAALCHQCQRWKFCGKSFDLICSECGFNTFHYWGFSFHDGMLCVQGIRIANLKEDAFSYKAQMDILKKLTSYFIDDDPQFTQEVLSAVRRVYERERNEGTRNAS